MMNIQTLKLFTLCMMIFFFVVTPYEEAYHECIQGLQEMEKEVPNWFLHIMLSVDMVIPALTWKIYPFAVGLFDVKGVVGIQENLKAKKHWIIVGILLMVCGKILTSDPTYNDSLYGIMLGIWIHIIYALCSFSLMYCVGLFFAYISRKSLACRDYLKEKVQQRINRSA